MPLFYFNLHEMGVTGHGCMAAMPGVNTVAQALAEAPDDSEAVLASPEGTPFASSPVLTERLREGGMVRWSNAADRYEKLSVAEYERALRAIVRHPLERAACCHLDKSGLLYKRLRYHLKIEAHEGDIPQVHEAIHARRTALLELEGVWELASPFLSAAELLRIVRYCKGWPAGYAIGHPRFPIEGAFLLIAKFVARRMRTPDMLLMYPKRMEHHIDEVGNGDFLNCNPSYVRRWSLINRNFWWYLFFSKEEETPEDRLCKTIDIVVTGLKMRPEEEQEAILAEMESRYPNLAWLLRDVRDNYSHRLYY